MTAFKIEIRPLKISRFLVCTIVALTIMAVISVVVTEKYASAFLDKFKMDSENNLVSYFSSLELAIVSILLFLISQQRSLGNTTNPISWKFLSLIFALLSIDETVSIHEHITYWLQSYLKITGAPQRSWAFLGLLVILIFLFSYRKFIRNIPKENRRDFVFAGFVYVTGALAFEFIGGNLIDILGDQSWQYKACGLVEETLEMTGIFLFIKGLFRYILSQEAVKEKQAILHSAGTDSQVALVHKRTFQDKIDLI